uniref:solute carrier family 2, facilitated glucose transporter member 5 n=1 Tax=Jaculus jaculus TaxID=51337 RepID=UPI001E1B29EC|nr:solute carrier family 2, facilitated glucose transporter member 5 [Jaculus jaculus]
MEEQQKKEGRITLVLALATLIAAFGSSFQYGYNVAAVNSPSELMKQFYNNTYYDRTGKLIESFHLMLLWSVTVSMFPFGGFIGSLLVGPMVNNLGRKGALLFNNIFSIVPAIFMGCSEIAASFELIIVSRLLVGICAGVSSNVVPMYLGELAPKNLRGALGVIPQLFITIGILVAQLFGLRNLLANEEGWPILLGLTGVPAALQLLVLPFFPESPRYLLIQKKDQVAARKALQTLRGWDEVDTEMEEIRKEDEEEKAAGSISVWRLLQMKSLRWQLISIIVLMGGQQLSGVNAIYYYADEIYLSAGVKSSDVQYVTAGTGAVNVFMTVFTVFVVELWGRRLLLLLGFSTCMVSCGVLTAALALQDAISWMPYVSIACVIIYVIGHAVGPSPIPALFITEVFLQSSRPAAYMIGGSVHWLSNFTVGLVFPFIQVGLGPYSFIVFGTVCLLTTIYIFLVVPETKAKTFIEINHIFAKKNKVSEMEIYPEKEEFKTSQSPLCIAFSALPMYLGELAPKDLRGMLGTMTEIFVITGISLAQIFSLQAILGNSTGWPVLLALTGVPAVLQLLSLPFFPESPRYTLIQKGDEETARRALRRLRGHERVEAEIEDMRAEESVERAAGRLSGLKLLTSRPLRWQLLTVVVLMAGQQLSGISAVNYYADTIYTSAGVEPAHSQYVTVGAGVLNIAMTIISAVTIERLGRRFLLLAGYGICGSACLVLTVALLLQNKVPELSYLAVICVFVYIAGHSIGPSPVPSIVRTEIFLQSSRPAAFMVDGAVHWLTNFIVGLVFPSIQAAAGAYSFVIFAALCALTAIYIYLVIPETKGKTFVEINRAFAKRNGVELPEEREVSEAHVPSVPAKETSF